MDQQGPAEQMVKLEAINPAPTTTQNAPKAKANRRPKRSLRSDQIRAYIRDPDGHLIEVGQATGIVS